MPDDLEPGGLVPPGVGPAGELETIQRRRYPLRTVGVIIALPLIVILVIFLVRLLAG